MTFMIDNITMFEKRHSTLMKVLSIAITFFLVLRLSSELYAEDAAAILPIVVLETALGEIEIEVNTGKAPLSSASFLAHIESGLFVEAGGFYRAVRSNNIGLFPAHDVIQGGLLDYEKMILPSVPHESTIETGLSHTHGTVSLARLGLGSANGGTFFICIGDQSGLDDGGQVAKSLEAQRGNDYTQGFSAFGQVIKGMDIVTAIQKMDTTHWPNHPEASPQYLRTPVRFLQAYRR